MLALAPSRMRALAHGVEVAGLERRNDIGQALITAADESLGQFPLEIDVAAGEFAAARRDRSPVRARRAFKKRLSASITCAGFDRFAEVRIHAGGNAFFAILAHDIRGERDDRQPFRAAADAPDPECAASR